MFVNDLFKLIENSNEEYYAVYNQRGRPMIMRKPVGKTAEAYAEEKNLTIKGGPFNSHQETESFWIRRVLPAKKDQGVKEGNLSDILNVPGKVLRTARDVARGMPTGTSPDSQDGTADGDLVNTATKIGKQVIDAATDAARGMPTGTSPKQDKDKEVKEQGVAEAGNKPVEKSYFGMGDTRTPRELKKQMHSASDKFVQAASEPTGPIHSRVAKMQNKLAKSELRKRNDHNRLATGTNESVAEGSAQEKLYKRHQELRKKRGAPDPEYYQELKSTFDLPDDERWAKTAELKKKYQVTNEDRDRYVEELDRAGYEIVTESATLCPECGGVAYSNRMLAEKQDACYHKVKSRYKVWPSAYASGALVRCRKVGAANWGNKSKK